MECKSWDIMSAIDLHTRYPHTFHLSRFASRACNISEMAALRLSAHTEARDTSSAVSGRRPRTRRRRSSACDAIVSPRRRNSLLVSRDRSQECLRHLRLSTTSRRHTSRNEVPPSGSRTDSPFPLSHLLVAPASRPAIDATPPTCHIHVRAVRLCEYRTCFCVFSRCIGRTIG